MNSIMMIVGAVIAILLVFIIFSQSDQDDEPDLESLNEDVENDNAREETPKRASVPLMKEAQKPSDEFAGQAQPSTVSESNLSTSANVQNTHSLQTDSETPPEVGTEEDLKFRLMLNDQMPPPTAVKSAVGVAATIQIRFLESSLVEGPAVIPFLTAIEGLLDTDLAPFPYSIFLGDQFDRLLLFGFDESRDDAVLESLVTLFDLIYRFKKALEKEDRLLKAKPRIAVGVSFGEISRILRGSLGPISHLGRAVYLSETLAEAAGDFQIYVDEEIHRLALPLFDFREWKPMKLRPPLPPIAFFEVVGWNKKDEIFAFSSHKEVYARRAVAVAFRYLDFDDLSPLLSLLADSDEKVALEALTTIIEIGDDRALGILKKILPEARSPFIRSSIMEAFGKVGKEDLVPVLLAATKDINWQVRFYAVKSLFRITGPEAMKHIEHLVNDDDGAVRVALHQILYKVSGNDNHLMVIREHLTDLSQRARKAAVEALLEICIPASVLMVARSYADQEPDLRRHILRLMTRTKSNVLYQAFLEIFHYAEEKDRTDIVSAVRRSRLTA